VTKPVTLVSIAITPTAPTLFNGTTLQLTATGTYSDNSTQNLTGSVSWNSSMMATATVSNTAPVGVVTALALGTTTITATSGSPAIASPAVTVTVIAAEHAYAANFGSSNVSQYNVTNGGGLTPMSTPTVTAGTGPFSIAIDPSKHYAYVANYGTDNTPNDTVSQYTIAASGALTPMSQPTVTTGLGPNGVTATAKSVYVANYNGGSVSQYTIQSDGSLLPMTTASVPAGAGAAMVALTPSGTYAYVPNVTDGTVSGYSVNSTTGALTSLGAAFPAGTGADFVAIDPSGKYAYVANSNGGSISQYAINATTGSLSPLTPATVTTINPGSIAIDPKGPYVYVANGTSSQNATQGQSVSQYTIAANGALTPMNPATVAAGLGASSVTVDPTNQFVYVTNRGSATTPGSTLSQYVIGPSGSLTPLSPATVTAGTQPAGVVVSTAN
jgi:6-phosphogluconolactonase (cycloisomerase 2 family)